MFNSECFIAISRINNYPAIIAIDGNAGAGKTTLATEISTKLLDTGKSSQIVHMDDLYEGWQNPFTVKLANRVITDVLEPFLQKIQTKYQVFDWKQNKFDSEKLLNKVDFLILEGVGSGQSAFRNYIDFLIWIDINPAEGLTKVISRDGTKNSQQMQQFLLDQERHFALENTQNASDWQITSVP